MLVKIAPGSWIQAEAGGPVRRVSATRNRVEIDTAASKEIVECENHTAAIAQADRIAKK